MILGIVFFLQVLVTPVTASLTPSGNITSFALTAAECKSASQNFFSIPTWYKYLDFEVKTDGNGKQFCSAKASFLSGGKFNGSAFTKILLAVVDILMRVGALIAVGFVLYGGFTYITSQGEPDGTKRGRTTIVNALVGLVIAIFASGIVAFIGGRLGS